MDHSVVILSKTLQFYLSPQGEWINALDPLIDYRVVPHPGAEENTHLIPLNIVNIHVHTTLYIPPLPLHQTVQPHHTSHQSLHLRETTEQMPVTTSARWHWQSCNGVSIYWYSLIMFINHIIHICLSSESGKAWIDFNHYDQLYRDQIKKAKKKHWNKGNKYWKTTSDQQ